MVTLFLMSSSSNRSISNWASQEKGGERYTHTVDERYQDNEEEAAAQW